MRNNMSLLDKMKKTGFKSVTSRTKLVKDAVDDIFGELIPTNTPAFNIAISGKYDGGVGGGLVSVAGPSKHFKTLFCLLAASTYTNAHKDAIVLYYDSEGGASLEYLEMMNIDVDRVLHLPIKNVEELKFDLMQKLEAIENKEKVFIMIDSIGNLASKKEMEDAINEKSVADMSRAKAIKSLFRMVTPYVKEKNIPMYAVQHVYKSIDMFPSDIMSGGCVDGETEIIAKRGLVKMKDIRVGDLVLSHDDTWNEVEHTWNPETLGIGHPERYKVTFEDGTEVICSENHKFLVEDQWVEISNINIGTSVK